MRSFRHRTPRYVYNRLVVMLDEFRHRDWPWLTRGMVEILQTWLRPEDRGLEFGSGRSTLWLGTRVGHLTSVEHDPEWYATISEKLRSSDVLRNRIDYHLCEALATDAAPAKYIDIAKLAES